MNVHQIIKKVREKGIRLSVESGRLKISATKGIFDDEIIEAIKQNKDALIRLLSHADYEPIPAVKPSESYPLSYAQSVFWILNQLGHKDSAHNITSIFRCKGNLNIPSLEKAFKKLIAKHEILRTVFKENQQGTPAQFILPNDITDFKIIHNSLDGFENDEKKIRNTLHEEITYRFNLSTWPLFRISVVLVSDTETILCCIFNHIIVDGWSMFLIMKEVLKFYDEIEAQQESDATPLKIHYKDFTVWQATQTEQAALQKKYWNEKLKAPIPLLSLPSFKDRPAIKTYNGNTTAYFFQEGLLKKIHNFSVAHNTSVFTVLMAGLNTIFNRYTGDNDIVVGTLVAGREHPDLEDQIGMYANMLALRTTFDGDCSFLQLLEVQKKSILNDFEHQNYPYNKLLTDLNIKKDLSRSPLFDVVAIFQNQDSVTGISALENENLKIAPYEKIKTFTSQVDLKFDFLEDNAELRLRIEYNTDIYEEEFVQRLFQHLQNCLESVLDFPDQPISEIDFLSAAEKEAISNFGKQNAREESLTTAVSNSKIMILSDKFMEQPIGVFGKIFTQTTASDPKKDSGKTGRWLPDGTLAYHHEKKAQEPQTVSALEELHILASFTVDPLSEKLQWFLKEFEQPYLIKLGKYHQVFQESLAAEQNEAEGLTYIILNRFEDYITDKMQFDAEVEIKLEQVYENLSKIVTDRSQTNTIIIVFSPVNEKVYNQKLADHIHFLNQKCIDAFVSQANVHCIDLKNTLRFVHPVPIFDEIADEIGHIPFTETFFQIIAQQINRVLWSLSNKSCKVIALDCDNTLWEGVCGECKTNDLVISDGHKLLQQFMIQKYKEGFLLVLLSKNNENDVWSVFENHPEMLLTKAHLASWKINWDSKATNIRQLSEELNLGLNSFAFIDDNPLECNLMMEENPEVLTLELPENPQNFNEFLHHVISFDKLNVSKEDTLRTQMYKTEKKRIESRKKLNLESFLESLSLELSFNHVKDDQIDRVVQLAQRTNQFSLNGIRKNKKEIADFIKAVNNSCFVLEARDKFGDYGLVGSVLVRLEGQTLFIEHFMLSCRILGRSIEEAVITILKHKFNPIGCNAIVAKYVDTKKNVPIRDFFVKNNWRPFGLDERNGYTIKMEYISDHTDYVNCYLDEELPVLATENETEDIEKDTVGLLFYPQKKHEKPKEVWSWEKKLINESQLHHKHAYKALEYANLGFLKKLDIYAAETNPENHDYYDSKLISFYRILLNIQNVLVTDRFFDLGGNSINATQLVSKIYQEFNLKLELTYIFENKTIKEISQHIKEQKEIDTITQVENIDDIDSYEEVEF